MPQRFAPQERSIAHVTHIMNPIRLEITRHLFASIPDEMGALLRRASYSPNIKERLDFSCAVFDAQGGMIAQAAHIPVHLGAMPLSVRAAVARFNGPGGARLQPGDVVVLNDPYHGGSHLPDITMVSPVYLPNGALSGFAASRAHHADIGGMSAGSMPIARHLIQEGLILPPVKILSAGRIQEGVWDLIMANVRTPEERAGDLRAQLAANARGVLRMQAMAARYGAGELASAVEALYDYTERLMRALLREIGDGTYRFEDRLDGDGLGSAPIPIRTAITIDGDRAVVDFEGTARQQRGSVNAVVSITLSAVAYVFRALSGLDVPNNSGALPPVELPAPAGSRGRSGGPGSGWRGDVPRAPSSKSSCGRRSVACVRAGTSRRLAASSCCWATTTESRRSCRRVVLISQNPSSNNASTAASRVPSESRVPSSMSALACSTRSERTGSCWLASSWRPEMNRAASDSWTGSVGPCRDRTGPPWVEGRPSTPVTPCTPTMDLGPPPMDPGPSTFI